MSFSKCFWEAVGGQLQGSFPLIARVSSLRVLSSNHNASTRATSYPGSFFGNEVGTRAVDTLGTILYIYLVIVI
jgi:hypothetical protein